MATDQLPPAKEAAPAKTPSSADVASAIKLLEWARAKGFRIGPTLHVGSVTMQVSDVRQLKLEALDRGGPVDDGPYAEAGLGDAEPAEGTIG